MAAKDRNAASKRKIKLQNNATSKLPLRCQVPHCQTDFYVRMVFKGKFTRLCPHHYANPPQDAGSAKNRKLLTSLGLL